jgi:leucyl aminopeptidase
MEFTIATTAPESVACDALALPVVEDRRELEGAAARVDRALGGVLAAAIAEERFEGNVGATLVLHTHGKIPARRVIVVGLGPRAAVTLETHRRAAGAVVRRAAALHARHVAFPSAALPGQPSAAVAQARLEGILLAAYHFARYKARPDGAVEQVTLLVEGADEHQQVEDGRRRGALFAEATCFARDLVNEPPNHLPPARLAEIAQETARQHGLRCEVLDEAAMRAQGMNGILAVGGGSAQPPRLIVLEYAPSRAQREVALVGKGVCYDSGGINLKHSDLEWMKGDMAGGAAVLAVMRALPALQPQVRVRGVIAAVENMPGGRSMKPGDIIRALSGKTIEITNTDAEGRVILADAVAYAAQRGAEEIIDLATLTGSAMVALGYYAAALMSNDDALAGRLLAAAERAGERLWRLPLYEEYLEDMRSQVADLRNSGGRYGGAQKGAIFIREFAGGRPWAHLDIAPTAFLEKEEGTGPYTPKGGTGYGVRTLLTYLSGVA